MEWLRIGINYLGSLANTGEGRQVQDEAAYIGIRDVFLDGVL
jgi:hypothetical protein